MVSTRGFGDVAIVLCALVSVGTSTVICTGANIRQIGSFCTCLKDNGALEQCTPTQDCSPTTGCGCSTQECACGNTFCLEKDFCDMDSKTCKCGKTKDDAVFCDDNEICYLGECYCDPDKLKKCSAKGHVCKNKECVCGERACTGKENCIENNDVQFCACGDFWRRCEANEVCANNGTEYSCKCGTEDCDYGETCVEEGGVYTCKCGNSKCRDNESCFKPASGTPFCICGKKGCDSNEECVERDGKLGCMCGADECRSWETCGADKTCSEVQEVKCEDTINNCDTMKDLCFHNTYKTLMAEQCARTCNLCPDTCDDQGPGCDSVKPFCNEPGASQIANSICTKTCGLCKTS